MQGRRLRGGSATTRGLVEVGLTESDQRDALDLAALHRRSLDDDLEMRELGVGSEPRTSGRQHATLLLGIDHLEGMTEPGSPLLLHCDDDETTTAPENEVELVAACTRVGFEQSIAAEPVVEEGAALAAIHAAS